MNAQVIADVMALVSAAGKVVTDVRAKIAAAKSDGKVTAAEAAAIVEAELATLAPAVLALVQDLIK